MNSIDDCVLRLSKKEIHRSLKTHIWTQLLRISRVFTWTRLTN